MKVCVIGLGYIGFPTACLMASGGHEVIGVETNIETVDLLNNGKLHIINEEGLFELSRKVLAEGKLRVIEKPEKADAFIITVPTPCRAGATLEEKADLSYVKSATESIIPYLEKGNLVILESTVPPGTTEKVVGGIIQQAGFQIGDDILLSFAPERVLPGNIMKELVNNHRLIGGATKESGEKAMELYSTFVKGTIYLCNARTAEMVKLMENTFRDVNIALANELALLAEQTGVNVFDAIELANNHPRVNILKPGPGVGGHCIAEDPWFLISVSPKHSSLMQTARKINMGMPQHILELFRDLQGKNEINRVAILGVSYKANVGDIRNSPGLKIAEMIRSLGKEVVVHDPYIKEYDSDILEILKGIDVFLLITDHDCYREKLIPEEVGQIMKKKLAIDTRNFLGKEWDENFQIVRLGVGKFG